MFQKISFRENDRILILSPLRAWW